MVTETSSRIIRVALEHMVMWHESRRPPLEQVYSSLFIGFEHVQRGRLRAFHDLDLASGVQFLNIQRVNNVPSELLR